MYLKKIRSGLFRDTIIYGLTNALFTGLPLLLLPFLVTLLSPADYGTMELFRSISMVFVPILGLSTVQAITRYYYDLDSLSFNSFTSSVLLLNCFNAVIAIIILSLVDIFIDSQFINLSYFAVVYFLFNQITEAILSIYRIKKMSKWYLIIRLGSVALDLLLLFALYNLLANYDWRYRVIGRAHV